MSKRDDLFDRSKESEVTCIVIWYRKFTNRDELTFLQTNSKREKFYIVKSFDKLSFRGFWVFRAWTTVTRWSFEGFLRWRKSLSVSLTNHPSPFNQGRWRPITSPQNPSIWKLKTNKPKKKRQVQVNNLIHVHPDSIRSRFYSLIVKICPDSVTIKPK